MNTGGARSAVLALSVAWGLVGIASNHALGRELHREKTTALSIPNNQTWVSNYIDITGLPEDALVAEIDVSFTGSWEHPDPSDFEVHLNDEGVTVTDTLWDNEGGVFQVTHYGIHAFDGLPVNGRWKLYARDNEPCCPEDPLGRIESWWITIYFTCGTCPFVQGFRVTEFGELEDNDDDDFAEYFEFDLEVNVAQIGDPMQVKAKFDCPEANLLLWRGPWTIDAGWWQPWAMTNEDFEWFLTGEEWLTFEVELWNPNMDILWDVFPFPASGGSVPVEPYFPEIRNVWIQNIDQWFWEDADQDGFYETFDFIIGIQADCEAHSQAVATKILCTPTGQAWTAGPWWIEGPNDGDSAGVTFSEVDFSNYQGNADLYLTVELWDHDFQTRYDSTSNVVGQPIKADNNILPDNVTITGRMQYLDVDSDLVWS